MPVNDKLSNEIWQRFQQMRDSGHDRYVEKAELCEAFHRGDQWSASDVHRLSKVNRPALTINKIKPTVANVRGEQIRNRAEVSFRPRSPEHEPVADALNKVFKQISDQNHLNWRRSDMFADGVITSRGFLDVRLDKRDSTGGEVRITNVNPKNVVVDPDADEYDPDEWADVIITKWYTSDDIAVLYGKHDAELLREKTSSAFPYGYDSIDAYRDRFARRHTAVYSGTDPEDTAHVERAIRVIDRQYRKLDRQKMFVERETGDMRPVPEDFDRDRIAWFTEKFGFAITTQLVRRIRWTCVADDVVLHDDWSPYKHFTIVPYFPDFRYGQTIGFVENLISPQENLNKIRSQELHVVNSSANGGWKIKTGNVTNMTNEELEEKGAMTGLVIEVADMEGAEKINPNQVPQGLDRISYKSEEDIKTISGVSDSMQGFDREDVAAKAIQAKKQSGATNLVQPLDMLNRTDTIMARNILDLVQEFYTEERLISITGDQNTQRTEYMTVNQVTPEGTIVNDLTLGEFDVIVTTVPVRDTSEDSQFEQAVAMKEMGVMIPDTVIVANSRLQNKQEVIRQMLGDQDSPEAQAQKALQMRGQQAAVAKAEAEVQETGSKAGLNQAKTQETLASVGVGEAPKPPTGPSPQAQEMKLGHDMTIDKREQDRKEQESMASIALEREKNEGELQLKAKEQQDKAQEERIKRMQAAAAQMMKPQKPQT